MKRIGFFLAGVLMAQAPQMDVGRLLGSGRSDLWAYGVNIDPKDFSAEVRVCSRKLPKELWLRALGPDSAEVQYSERPRQWDWQHGLAFQLKVDEGRFHLSKYDDHSAFSAGWGVGTREDGTYFNKGAILRFEDGHLQLVSDALKQARADYGLSEFQNFLGMVENKIFYFDTTLSDRIFYFEKGYPDQRYELVVQIHPLWPRNWKLASVDQVFSGEKPGEILAYVWVKNKALISTKPRKDAMGVCINLNTAMPVVGRMK